MNHERDSERHLRDYLDAGAFGSEFTLNRLDLGVDGWAFFRVIPNVTDTNPTIEVVREDGTVVTEDPEGELGEIYRTMGVLEDDDPDGPTLVRIARTLLATQLRPVLDFVTAEHLAEKYSTEDVSSPSVEETQDGMVITFWGEEPGGMSVLYRCVLRIDPEYTVEWTQEEMASRGDPSDAFFP